jgi:hypothetical protein
MHSGAAGKEAQKLLRSQQALEMRHATCVCVKQQELSGFTFAEARCKPESAPLRN